MTVRCCSYTNPDQLELSHAARADYVVWLLQSVFFFFLTMMMTCWAAVQDATTPPRLRVVRSVQHTVEQPTS